jgi:hypothetical protein
MFMTNSYSQQWGGTHPGCLILLLDQSRSMSDSFGYAQAGGGKRKCDMLATVLNGFLNELIVTNTVMRNDNSAEVRPRADVVVLGYGGTTVEPVLMGMLEGRRFVSLPELHKNPLRIEKRIEQEVDDTGNILELEVDFPIWVEPQTGGGTPMCAALWQARDLAEQWARENSYNYPPVVINVTDGMATDGDPITPAYELCRVSTNDGQALLFTVHLTHINSAPIAYPASENELPEDSIARKLFTISSIIPESSRKQLQSLLGRDVFPGARGLIFNGDAASVRQMFVFASVPATQPLDPNR